MKALTQPDVATAVDGFQPVKADPFAPVFLPFCFPLPAPTACVLTLTLSLSLCSPERPQLPLFNTYLKRETSPPAGAPQSVMWSLWAVNFLAYVEIQLMAARGGVANTAHSGMLFTIG